MARMTLCLAILAALATPAAAQTGRVYGSLTDPSGAVLPAVEVRALLRDANGETVRSVLTDAKGSYQMEGLTPGEWTVTASLPGFETATRRQTIQTGDSVEWSPMLELGMIQETITITTDPADAPAPRARTVNVAPPPPPPAPAPAGVGTGGWQHQAATEGRARLTRLPGGRRGSRSGRGRHPERDDRH